MKVLQEMKRRQINGKKSESLKIEFLTYQPIITDGLLDLYDHADLILKYFIEYENQSFLLNEVMYEMTKIIGWKYGTMFSWNFIVTKAELSQN
jgi:hypothetical protein